MTTLADLARCPECQHSTFGDPSCGCRECPCWTSAQDPFDLPIPGVSITPAVDLDALPEGQS
ncbi:hypothetical protein EV383_4492 [Pseudonocardia sediminis]|uniref:Uncharacterized protein n=1 Tax=Pseudonocardia sediminis TaxID=1397368 RepID=A0A4Q7UZI0_PSEST|nr:hypothetical protein [Pseudonocardia sediminis]RZT87567.1 hypothetical protein EV383_4492 [Pseudonocardia sediminis]